MKKILHEIRINAVPKRAPMFSVTIGNKKQQTVTLRVGADKLSVSCELSTRSRPGSSLSAWSTALARGIKAAMLLHILLYGRELRVRRLYWRLGDGPLTEFIPKEAGPFVYSLLRCPGPYRLSGDWKREEIVRTVLALSQKETDHRLAALHAYMMGKAADSQTERFLCFWMAINGLYDFHYTEVLGKSANHREKDRIAAFQRCYGKNCSFLSAEECHKCFAPLNQLFYRYPGFLAQIKDPASRVSKAARDTICEKTDKDYQINAYCYYLLQHCYTLRCKLFHATHPMKLLSFAEESEIIVLRTLSDLMEDFLDRNLHRWFDEAYIDKTLRPRTEDPKAFPPVPYD